MTRKPQDQLAPVVSVWKGPIFKSRVKKEKKSKIGLVSDNPDVLQLQLRRHSIKEMDSQHKPGPLGQSFGFLGVTTNIGACSTEKILLLLLLLLLLL